MCCQKNVPNRQKKDVKHMYGFFITICYKTDKKSELLTVPKDANYLKQLVADLYIEK